MTMGFIVGYLVFIGYLVFTYIACLAQARLIKECPIAKQAQTGFEPEKYLGVWYQYSAYWNIWEGNKTCTTAFYTDASDESGLRIRVNNVGMKKNGKAVSSKGYATVADPNDPTQSANLIVNFDNTPGQKSNSTNYQVLSTDYDSYATVYDCLELPKLMVSSQHLYVLTRERIPSKQLIDNVYESLESIGLETAPLRITAQEDCPDFPPDCC